MSEDLEQYQAKLRDYVTQGSIADDVMNSRHWNFIADWVAESISRAQNQITSKVLSQEEYAFQVGTIQGMQNVERAMRLMIAEGAKRGDELSKLEK